MQVNRGSSRTQNRVVIPLFETGPTAKVSYVRCQYCHKTTRVPSNRPFCWECSPYVKKIRPNLLAEQVRHVCDKHDFKHVFYLPKNMPFECGFCDYD